MNIIQRNRQIDGLINNSNSANLSEDLSILAPKKSSSSLGDYEMSNEDVINFLSMSKSVEEGIGTGTGADSFPGIFLIPKKMNAYISRDFMELLVEYYNNAYDTNIFVLPEDLDLDGSIGIYSIINQYGRIRISDEVFGSTFSKRYESSSRILAKFADEDGVNTYPGQVQFFFEHYLDYPEESTKHSLAYVRWYKKIKNENLRCHLSIGKKDDKLCNVELWHNDFYDIDRDCIIPVHNILGRFVAGTFTVGSRKHQDYMSVIPLNRKYNI